MISLACLDMAGTTVRDDGLVETAASRALARCGVWSEAAMQRVRDTMGQSKITVFCGLFDLDTATEVNTAFEAAYAELVTAGKVCALPGAEKTFARLRDAGVKVVLTTGFSLATQHILLAALGWTELVDLALAPAAGLRGRPAPDLVWHAALRLGADSASHILVAGDSMSDMECGLAAGAGKVVGVLGGAHDRRQLREAGATHLVEGVGDILTLI